MIYKNYFKKHKYQTAGNITVTGNIAGTVLPVDKNNNPQVTLPPTEIKASSPDWLNEQKELEANYPVYKGNRFLQRFMPKRYNSSLNLYNQQKTDYINEEMAKKIMQRIPYNNQGADNYLKGLTETERNILLPSNRWRQEKSYLSMIEQGMLGSSPFNNYVKNKHYTPKEAYESGPLDIAEGVGGYAAKPLQAMANKAGITNFENANQTKYTMSDALQGKQNDAGIIADALTDVTNYLSVGGFKQGFQTIKPLFKRNAVKLPSNPIRKYALRQNGILLSNPTDEALRRNVLEQLAEMKFSDKFNTKWVYKPDGKVKLAHTIPQKEVTERLKNLYTQIHADFQDYVKQHPYIDQDDYYKHYFETHPLNEEVKKLNKNIIQAYDKDLDPTFRQKIEDILEQAGYDKNFSIEKDPYLHSILGKPGVLLNPTKTNVINKLSHRARLKNYLNSAQGVQIDDTAYTFNTDGFEMFEPKKVGGINSHEKGHLMQKIANWRHALSKYDPDYKYIINRNDSPLGQRITNALKSPTLPESDKSTHNTWESSIIELHSELQRARYLYYRKLVKEQGLSEDEAIKILKNPNDEIIDELFNLGDLNKHFKAETPINERIEIIKLLPAITGAAIGTKMLENNNQQEQRKYGGQAPMVKGTADIITKIKNFENRKSVANSMLRKFKKEKLNIDKNNFLKLSNVKYALGGEMSLDELAAKMKNYNNSGQKNKVSFVSIQDGFTNQKKDLSDWWFKDIKKEEENNNTQNKLIANRLKINGVPNIGNLSALASNINNLKYNTEVLHRLKTLDLSSTGTDVATKTNNPGNMKFHPWMSKYGAVPSGIKGTDGGVFAAFPTIGDGLAAYEMQLFGHVDGVFKSAYYKENTTVDEALRIWSNNGYGGEIYPEIANKKLSEVTDEERKKLAALQFKQESKASYKKLIELGLFSN